MTTNEAIVRRVIEEGFDRGKMDMVDALVSADYVSVDPASPEPIRGPEEVKEMIQATAPPFPT